MVKSGKEYKKALGGKLKLKIKLGKAKDISKKLKKSKKKKKDKNIIEEDEIVQDVLTESQRKMLALQKARKQDNISKMVSSSHREKVREYNTKLANLSEHHDIPKT